MASARHELLVLQLAAHMDDARLSLAGKRAGVLARLQEKADFTISQSALSIWLGRAKNSAGVTASLFAKIDDVVATYLESPQPLFCPNCKRRRLTAAMSSTHLNCGGDEAVCVCRHS